MDVLPTEYPYIYKCIGSVQLNKFVVLDPITVDPIGFYSSIEDAQQALNV